MTATFAKSGYDGSITVAACSGTATSIGVASAAADRTTHPQVTLTTRTAGSLIWAVGHDWDKAKNHTPDAGETVVHQFVDQVAYDTFWTQRLDRPATGPAGAVG